MFFLRKYNERVVNSFDLCLETLISLTFRKMDIIFIYYIGKYFESQLLSIRVIPHRVLKQAIDLGLEFEDRYLKLRVILVMTYV